MIVLRMYIQIFTAGIVQLLVYSVKMVNLPSNTCKLMPV